MPKGTKYIGINGGVFSHESTHESPKQAQAVPYVGRLASAREYLAATKDYTVWVLKTLTATGSQTAPPADAIATMTNNPMVPTRTKHASKSSSHHSKPFKPTHATVQPRYRLSSCVQKLECYQQLAKI